MKLSRTAPPLVGLLLITAALPIVLPSHRTGVPIEVVGVGDDCSRFLYGDSFTVVVRILSRDQIMVNQNGPIAVAEYRKLIHEIFKRRAEKLFYLAAENSLEWQEFVRIVDIARGEGIRVGWITPQIKQHKEAVKCGYYYFPRKTLQETLALPYKRPLPLPEAP